MMDDPSRTRAVYVISVAAELAGVHPQTLRIYERKGLVEPARTGGGSRRYSEDDINLLRRIQALTDAGLNLAGVKRVLELEDEIARLREELARARAEAGEAVEETHRQYRRDLVPAQPGPDPVRPQRLDLRRPLNPRALTRNLQAQRPLRWFPLQISSWTRRRGASGQGRTERLRAKSPAGSVIHRSRRRPAAASSASTPARRNLALISVRSSSPAAKSTVRPRSSMTTVWSTSERRRISIHSSVGSKRATWAKRVEVEVGAQLAVHDRAGR